MEVLLSPSIHHESCAPLTPIPPSVEVASIRVSLLLHDEAIVLRTKGIEFENVGATTIMVRIDQDFEVVIQVLAHVAPQFGCDDPRRFRVIAINSEVHCVPGVQDA